MAVIKRVSSKAKTGKIEKYLKDPEKTEEKLISAMNCDSENFTKQCEMTNLLYNKNQNQNDRKYYHIVQSFSPKDNVNLTYEKAHEIGKQFAEKNFKGHEVLVVTHIDKEHIHNHFVVNSVSLENGKKYRADNKSLWQMRRTSNELCQQNGLVNSIQPLGKRAKEKISDTEIRGKESWKGKLKEQIREVLKTATSMKDFREKLFNKYEVETQITSKTRKGEKTEILEYKPKGNRKFFDGKKRLGEEYGKENIYGVTRTNAEQERRREETTRGNGEPARAEQSRTDTKAIENAIRERQIDIISADVEQRKRELEKTNSERGGNRERENKNTRRTESTKEQQSYHHRGRER